MNKWKESDSRVTRKNYPERPIRRTRYFKSLPNLKLDFEGRCAYSMAHESSVGGALEVDHFDASKKTDVIQSYDNLFPSSRICNGAKSAKPTKKEIREGKRFLNPCSEWDYNEQIREDPTSCELQGLTKAAKYHIEHLDLNHPHFLNLRKERKKIGRMYRDLAIQMKEGQCFEEFQDVLRHLRKELELAIPTIESIDPDS